MGLRDLVKYLVVKILAGRRYVADVLYEYFALGTSPREVANIHGLTIYSVRSYVQRAVEKAMSPGRARVLVKYVYPYVCTIEPVLIGSMCKICGEYVHPHSIEHHVRLRHNDLVEAHVERIMQALASQCRTLPSATVSGVQTSQKHSI